MTGCGSGTPKNMSSEMYQLGIQAEQIAAKYTQGELSDIDAVHLYQPIAQKMVKVREKGKEENYKDSLVEEYSSKIIAYIQFSSNPYGSNPMGDPEIDKYLASLREVLEIEQ